MSNISLESAVQAAHDEQNPVLLAQQIMQTSQTGLPEVWMQEKKRYLSRNDVFKVIRLGKH